MPETQAHPHEPHHENLARRLNWLRAGVLGANDGIISLAGLVVGVAGATTDRVWILITGLAGLVAGAFSMAGGEYTSVSAQRDSEKAMLELERWELDNIPEFELQELTHIYEQKGLSPQLAAQVARELTEHDDLAAHAEAELGIDVNERTNPHHAALSSFIAFTLGGVLPLLAIVIPTPTLRVPLTAVAVVVALALTGYVSASFGGGNRLRAAARTIGVGLITMTVTYLVGSLIGASVL